MLWCILFLIILVGFWYAYFCRRLNNDDAFVGIVLSIFFGGISIFVGAIGLLIYPDVVAQREGCLALQSEIGTIRQAHYPGIKSGQFVGGAIDNFEQSKVLSTYISEYAKEKACYNRNLARYKLYQKDQIYRWFGIGFLISKKIQELKAL